MTTTLLRAGALSCALLASTCLTAPAAAQTVNPRFSQIDANGVDLVTGQFNFSVTEGAIGSGEGALTLSRIVSGSNASSEWTGLLYKRTSGGTTLMYVEFGPIAETFTISGSTYTSTLANGGTLVDLGGGQYRYTATDGTQIVYDSDYEDSPVTYVMSAPQCQVANAGLCAIPLSVTRPNGMTFTLNWDIHSHCDGYDAELNCINPQAFFRFDGVSSSGNYSFSMTYQTDSPGNYSSPVPDWYKRTGAIFTNLASAPSPLPTSSYAYPSAGVYELTDIGGRTWRVTSGSTLAIRRPGSGSDDIVVTYSGGLVTQVVRDGVTTTYSRSTSGGTLTTTVTTAGNATAVASSIATGLITSITDPLSHSTSYQHDSNGRVTRVTQPEGNYVEYTYDARGNVTQTQLVPKSGSGASTITMSASYDSSCANPISCNRPNSTTDARNNSTSYTWSSTHGGLLTATAPAIGGVSPQTRITYSQVTAVTGQPVYLPTNVSACQTTSSCDGQADESETNISYGTSNLLPASVSRGSGNGALTATAALTYDSIGNLLTVDGPLSGTADTVRYRYNASRQAIGVIGPDPDGGGGLKHRAQRITYDSGGRPIDLERGTVNSQSDGDWAAFNPLERIEQDYDANARPIQRRLMSGGTTYAVTQTSYDSLGRVQCVATRMNPAEFGSLTSNACALDTQGTGSNDYGPDRIVRTTYDSAGRATLVQSGYGVSGVQADEAATAYTNNGQVDYVTDAEGNRTTYEYDGHDRLVKTRFPSPGTDNASSTTDYEQLTLDANGNVTSRRLRDNTSIGMTYDALNRLTARDLPGSEPDATYSYDLLNRMTGASQGGHTLTFTFDALGRNLSEANYLGTASSQYDLAGRRTRLTYPGSGLYVDYDYLVTGEVTAIRENGATSGAGVLGAYAYDDRGRRTSLTRGNATATNYYYDDVSRLSLIIEDPNNPTHDINLGYSYNPAGQIVAATRSNDAYAWGGHYPVNRTYTANGLNQYSAIASITPTYDSRGNLTSAGSITYGYNSDNMLASAGSSVALGYDPLLRLAWTTGSPNFTRFAYDGASLIAEYDYSLGLVRRFVHGPGVDAPLVQYEGSGTSDRRWFHADERGSVIAISNGSGVVTTVNTYDESGIPGSGNGGRFQYTGQMWLGELGMYHYRARMYSPTLGRFLQTDPIGFGGGMNIYAYVGNDPVNFTDPTGLACDTSDISPNEALVCGTRLVTFPGGGPGHTHATPGTNTLINENPCIGPEPDLESCVTVTGQGRTRVRRVGYSCDFMNQSPQEYELCRQLMRSDTIQGQFEILGEGMRRAREYVQNCISGLSSVNVSQAARDGARSFLLGALRRGILNGDVLAALRNFGWGALGSVVGGAMGSVIGQACEAGNRGQ